MPFFKLYTIKEAAFCSGTENIMAKEKLFSTCFRGFSPEEVINYIDGLNAVHKKTVFENETSMNAMSKELEAAKLAAGECDKLRAEISEKEKTVASKDEEIARLTADAENQRNAIEAQGDKISELENQIEELKAKLEASEIKCSAMENNSKEYEAMLADVDSILSSARRQAQTLIEEAELKGTEIIKSAREKASAEAESIISASEEKASEAISASEEKLSENVKKVKYLYRRQDELAELFKEHKSKVESFFSSISDVFTDKKD